MKKKIEEEEKEKREKREKEERDKRKGEKAEKERIDREKRKWKEKERRERAEEKERRDRREERKRKKWRMEYIWEKENRNEKLGGTQRYQKGEQWREVRAKRRKCRKNVQQLANILRNSVEDINFTVRVITKHLWRSNLTS